MIWTFPGFLASCLIRPRRAGAQPRFMLLRARDARDPGIMFFIKLRRIPEARRPVRGR
jgi:hypothetical protein